MELVTFQSSGFFFNLVSDQFFQVSDQWRLRKCRCRHVLRRLRSPAFDRLFCRSGRSASRDKPITRPIPQSARKKTGRASAASASDSRVSSSRSGPDSRQRVRWPDRLGSLAALPRLESFLTRRAGRVAVWGADADRSKLRGAGAARPGGVSSPSIGTPSVCTVVLARTPNRPSQRVKKPAQKKVQNLIGKKKKGCGILISDKYKLEEEGWCQ